MLLWLSILTCRDRMQDQAAACQHLWLCSNSNNLTGVAATEAPLPLHQRIVGGKRQHVTVRRRPHSSPLARGGLLLIVVVQQMLVLGIAGMRCSSGRRPCCHGIQNEHRSLNARARRAGAGRRGGLAVLRRAAGLLFRCASCRHHDGSFIY